MKKKIILITLLTIVICIFFVFRKQISYEIYRKVNIISAGSYPYAERYNLNFSEPEVKNAIKKFKELHSKYNFPENTNDYKFIDHQTQNPAYWYVTYFYFENENEILYTWIRENGKNETTLAFVSVKKIGTYSWKNINNDFNYDENNIQIEKFKKRILNVLIETLKANKGSR